MDKLIIKLLEIKNQSKRYREPPQKKNENKNKNTPKSHKKLKNFTKRWVKKVYDSPPHLNLTMSSLRAEETQRNIEIPKVQNKDY